jgi:hypothetical protein
MAPDPMFTDSKGRCIKSPSDGICYCEDAAVQETAQFVNMFRQMCSQQEVPVIG